jgi:ABC-type sugar transport system ATPase subunit
MNDTALLEMKNITKKFPGVVALDDVSFRVREGEIHGLIGENGAGKSTLMKILSGTYGTGEYEGEVWLGGEQLDMRSPSNALVQGIGVVPQEIAVLEELTVAENIVVGRWAPGKRPVISMRAISRKAEEFLASQKLDLDARQKVTRLTAAQKQEVMIARALYTEPSVLILDEPTSSMSLQEIENLFRILRDLREKGVTCIFITHKLSEIYELTDRTTVLRDGEVAGEFARDEYNDRDIITAMVGRTIDQLYPTRDSEYSQDEAFRVEDLTIAHPIIANRNMVEGVSFTLRRGEILGISGLVGAGRSEVVNAINGRLKFSGRIFVDGQEVKIRNTGDAKRAGIALVTEDRKVDGLLPDMTIRPNLTVNNLRLISNALMIRRRKERRVATEYSEKLNIQAPSIETLVTALSGGNQQKVVLGRVLLGEPKILLLDEPTKGVDVGAKNEIYKIMLDLVREGISIIMISSELPELLAMCDRFVVLAGGRIADEFDKAEASEHRVMLAATSAGGFGVEATDPEYADLLETPPSMQPDMES